MKIREKQAISLIVLVITILVLSILAATVIISLSNTNIISETSKTVLKSDLAAMQDMATVYFADNYNSIDMEKEYLITEFGITDDEFENYRDYAFVKAGKVYIKLNAPEDIQEVAEELNMLVDGISSSTGDVAVEKTVKALRIYGNTENAESVGEKSKNLFDWKFPNKGAYLVTNEFREDNLFLSITDKDTTVDISGIYLAFTDTQTYPFNLAQYLINDGTIAKTVVSNASTYKYLAVYPATQETVNKLNARFNIQVEEGSAATEYEPYGYNVPVTAVGKNLFDIDNISNVASEYSIQTKNNNIILSGTLYSCSSKKTLKQLCPSLKVGDVVTLSFDTTSSAKHIYLLSSKFVWRLGVTRTITEDDLNSIVYFYNESNLTESNEVIISNIQIEKGTTATAYEAYIGKTYNMYLNEPLRKLGNVADYIDCTTGEVVRCIGVTSAGELEVLSAPVKESVTLEEMNFEGVNHIFVDTTVTPSNIEVKY